MEITGHFYSAPSRLICEVIEARITDLSAAHDRHTTIPEHTLSAHWRYVEWTPARLMRRPRRSGRQPLALVEAIMRAKPHPEQGFRACLGILRLAKG